MKHLILMRHAKSDWSMSGDDHARPLNKRGVKSAKAMGDWLRRQAWLPDEVLCSSSTRTRQTLDLLQLGDTPTRFSRGLYLPDAHGILTALHEATGTRVLVVAHNFGIAEFANEIVTHPVDHPGFRTYPTCATLLASASIEAWSDLTFGSMSPEAFAVPREVLASREA